MSDFVLTKLIIAKFLCLANLLPDLIQVYSCNADKLSQLFSLANISWTCTPKRYDKFCVSIYEYWQRIFIIYEYRLTGMVYYSLFMEDNNYFSDVDKTE